MTTQRQSGLVVLLTTCALLGTISTSLYIPSMSIIAVELDTTLSAVQNTLSLFLLGFGVAYLFLGPLSDRFGRRPVMLAGMALCMLTAIACAQATSIEGLQIARFCQGFAACSGPVTASAIVRDRFEGVKTLHIFSLIGATVALSPALGPLIGGEIQVRFGWRAGFYFLACWGFLMLLLCGAFLRESNRHPVSNALAPSRLVGIYRSVLRQRAHVSAGLLVGFLFTGLFTYNGFAPFLLMDEIGIRPDHFGLLAMFIGSSMAIGNLLSRWLAKRVAIDAVIAIAILLSILGAVLMTSLSGELTIIRIVVPMMIFVLGLGVAIPCAMSIALHPFPHLAGSASAMFGFIHMGIAGALNITMGPLYDGTATPLGWAMLGMAGMALLCYPHIRKGHLSAES
uniref:Bcr/CflA family efflux transporter n=1 Tax=Candidatus Kentrum sp. FW TaxID=2126338 RepID=A0A450SKP7_9GAMM|nr:MAG: MFS transporter, DHA1 family, bicyclomycin/chloramphenicol resistance protein [Candidatus Kentron sp. FW]VFJ54117.1 MAG: MFS transporter, DHA1 family, bicyclomycin/chloramphenicol resistance protein [Candidatus Kentron sp. FW]